VPGAVVQALGNPARSYAPVEPNIPSGLNGERAPPGHKAGDPGPVSEPPHIAVWPVYAFILPQWFKRTALEVMDGVHVAKGVRDRPTSGLEVGREGGVSQYLPGVESGCPAACPQARH
jgi:hypothetical protein